MSIKTLKNTGVEVYLLSGLVLALYVAYGAIGRDIFFNSLQDPTAYDPIGAILNHVRVAICLAIIGVISFKCGIMETIRSIPFVIMPFTILAIVSNQWSSSESTFRSSMVLFLLCIALPLAMQRLGLRRVAGLLIQLMAVVMIASVFMALAFPSIGRHSGTEFMQSGHVGEWRGVFSHKNALGGWAGFASVFLFTHRSFVTGPSLYWWLARICAITCLALAHSVTGIFGAIVMYGTWILIKASAGNAIKFGIAAVLISIPVVLTIIFADDILGLFGRDASLTGRTEVWAIAWNRILESPLFGYGYLGYGGTGFAELIQSITGQALGIDSAYYSLLIDMGFVGSALFLIPIIFGLFVSVGRLNDFVDEDRKALEMMLIITAGTFFMGITEASSFFDTGFDGVVCFTGLLAMLTIFKVPRDSVAKRAVANNGTRRLSIPAHAGFQRAV